MKLKLNTALLTVFISFIIGFGHSVQAQQTSAVQNEDTGEVQVYYFHFKTRCETCRAVESEAQLDVQLLFGDDVKFTAVNLDEKEGEETGKKLGVNSQALLIVKGTTKINITNEGFLYALTDPDKLREIIGEKIKPLL